MANKSAKSSVKEAKKESKPTDTKNQPELKDADKDEKKVTENQKAADNGEGEKSTEKFQEARELEEKRQEDVANAAESEDQITDGDAIKTDGSSNVNADKGLPTTEAQKENEQSLLNGDTPKIEKTPEEQLGLANPDDRLAEELREAKLNPKSEAPAGNGYTVEAYQRDGNDTRTDDITFPDGAMKAQEIKDAQAGIDFHIQEAEANIARLKRLRGEL